MDGNKWTMSAAILATIASFYSAYQSSNAARDAANAAAISNTQVAALQKATTDRQSDIEMVKLALNILGGEVSDKTHESRQFAVNLLSRYSGVEVDDAVGEKWAETGTVSFAQKELGLTLSSEVFGRDVQNAYNRQAERQAVRDAVEAIFSKLNKP